MLLKLKILNAIIIYTVFLFYYIVRFASKIIKKIKKIVKTKSKIKT
jgi:hypothetical protein